MTPISIQNSLQNQYLGVEDQKTSRPSVYEPLENLEKSDRPSPKPIQAVIPAPEEKENPDETVMQELMNSSPQSAHPAVARPNIHPIEPFPWPDDRRVLGKDKHHVSLQESRREDTILQYLDSALHNPADQTIHQIMPLEAEQELDSTVHQFDKPLKMPQTQPLQSLVQGSNVWIPSFNPSTSAQSFLSGSGSIPSRLSSMAGAFFHSMRRIIDPRQWQSRLLPNKQLAPVKPRERRQINPPISNAVETEVQISSEQHQKMLRELDACRLSYAKELARNGKFKDAIAMARKVTETSRCFKDAQTLIRSWKPF